MRAESLDLRLGERDLVQVGARGALRSRGWDFGHADDVEIRGDAAVEEACVGLRYGQIDAVLDLLGAAGLCSRFGRVDD